MTIKKFTQREKLPTGGSFSNYLMANNSTMPEVGKYATQLRYTDRICYKVVEVSSDMKKVVLQILIAKADKSKPCGIGHQNWIFEETPYTFTIVWKRNAWRYNMSGEKLRVIFGEFPDYYYDWTF